MLFVSFVINCLIVIMVAFSLYAMYTGWNFMGEKGAMEAMGKEMFRFFTIDSNILMGICSLVMAIGQGCVLFGVSAEVNTIYYVFKYMGTSAVMLTFLVTTFFLVPQFKNPIILFYNSNLFFHLVVPLLSLLSFIILERTKLIPFKLTLFGVLPTMIYAIYYVTEIYRHIVDGKVDKHYDFYNFTNGKKEMTPIAAIVVVTISYLIGLLIWFLNRGM